MFRKLVILLLITKMLFCVDFKSFVGIDASYVLDRMQETSLLHLKDTTLNGFSIALNSGDEYFWGSYIGVRSYFTIGYSKIFMVGFNNPANLLDIGLALESMFNFYNNDQNSFGIFGGIDVSYHYWVNKEQFVNEANKHSFDMAARVGFSLLVMQNHRFEILARLPFVYMVSSVSRDIPLNFSFGGGYKYRY